MAAKTPVPKNEHRTESGAAVRLFVTEVMNIQKRLADQEHPEAQNMWGALRRFATNRASNRALE